MFRGGAPRRSLGGARSDDHGGHVVALPGAATELLHVLEQATDDLAGRHRAARLPQRAQPVFAELVAVAVGGLGDPVAVEEQGITGPLVVLMEAQGVAGDSVDEIRRNYQGYLDYLKSW